MTTQLLPLQVNYSSPHSELIYISAVNAWNKIQKAFGDIILKNLTTTQIKTLLTKKCIEINIDKYLSLNINGNTMLNTKFLLFFLLLLLLLL